MESFISFKKSTSDVISIKFCLLGQSWCHCRIFHTGQVMSSGIFKSPRIQMLYSNLEHENIVSYSCRD